MYQRLLGEVSDLRQGNRRRIRKGLWALVGVTVGLLALVFISQGSKVIFLLLWIVSMFGVAAYLIGVEYMDYQMQHKVGHIANMREGELSEILTLPESSPKSRLAARLRREADALEGVETPPEPEESIQRCLTCPARSWISSRWRTRNRSSRSRNPPPRNLRHKRPPPTKAPVEAARRPMSRRVSRRRRPARAAPPSPRVPVAPPARKRAAADEDYSLENILAEYGGDAAPSEPQPAQQPAAPTALAPRTAPLDLNQLMQEPQRMARVAHDLSLLSQALQGLSEDLWQQGEEGRK